MRTHRYIGQGRTRRTLYGHAVRAFRIARDMVALFSGALLCAFGCWTFEL